MSDRFSPAIKTDIFGGGTNININDTLVSGANVYPNTGFIIAVFFGDTNAAISSVTVTASSAGPIKANFICSAVDSTGNYSVHFYYLPYNISANTTYTVNVNLASSAEMWAYAELVHGVHQTDPIKSFNTKFDDAITTNDYVKVSVHKDPKDLVFCALASNGTSAYDVTGDQKVIETHTTSDVKQIGFIKYGLARNIEYQYVGGPGVDGGLAAVTLRDAKSKSNRVTTFKKVRTKKPHIPVKINRSHPIGKYVKSFVYFSEKGDGVYDAANETYFKHATNNVSQAGFTRGVQGVEGAAIDVTRSENDVLEIHDDRVIPEVFTVLQKVNYDVSNVDQGFLNIGDDIDQGELLIWADTSASNLRPAIAAGTPHYGTSNSIPSGEWVVWGVRINNRDVSAPTAQFWINGKEDGSESADLGNLLTSNFPWYYLNQHSGTRGVDGKVSWILVIDKELTAEEHEAVYENPWQLLEPETRYLFTPDVLRTPLLTYKKPYSPTDAHIPELDLDNPLTKGISNLWVVTKHGVVDIVGSARQGTTINTAKYAVHPKLGDVLDTRDNDTNSYQILDNGAGDVDPDNCYGGIVVGDPGNTTSANWQGFMIGRGVVGEDWGLFLDNATPRNLSSMHSDVGWASSGPDVVSDKVGVFGFATKTNSGGGADLCRFLKQEGELFARSVDTTSVNSGNNVPNDATDIDLFADSSASARTLHGDFKFAALWKKDMPFSAELQASLCENPWQLFKPTRKYYAINEKDPLPLISYKKVRTKKPPHHVPADTSNPLAKGLVAGFFYNDKSSQYFFDCSKHKNHVEPSVSGSGTITRIVSANNKDGDAVNIFINASTDDPVFTAKLSSSYQFQENTVIFKVSSTGLGRRILASVSNDILGGNGCEWGIRDTGRFGYAYNDGAVRGWYETGEFQFAVDEVFVVAIRWRKADGFVDFFKNGVLITSVATTTGTIGYTSADVLRIGRQPDNENEFEGNRYYDLFFDRCLSDGEIKQLYDNPYQILEPETHYFNNPLVTPTLTPVNAAVSMALFGGISQTSVIAINGAEVFDLFAGQTQDVVIDYVSDETLAVLLAQAQDTDTDYLVDESIDLFAGQSQDTDTDYLVDESIDLFAGQTQDTDTDYLADETFDLFAGQAQTSVITIEADQTFNLFLSQAQTVTADFVGLVTLNVIETQTQTAETDGVVEGNASFGVDAGLTETVNIDYQVAEDFDLFQGLSVEGGRIVEGLTTLLVTGGMATTSVVTIEGALTFALDVGIDESVITDYLADETFTASVGMSLVASAVTSAGLSLNCIATIVEAGQVIGAEVSTPYNRKVTINFKSREITISHKSRTVN